jgi:stearoyl-CoA 9-desaturase NADPH oxidoreductase
VQTIAPLLRAASWLTTPLLPEDIIGLVHPLWSGRQLRGLVIDVRPEGSDAATLVVRPGRQWRRHRAGQWARVGVEIDGRRHWRRFSLTGSAEGPARTITFTVKAGGFVSDHLVHATAPGDVLFLDAPQGDFVLPDHPEPLLMITAGSGITPVMAMLRTLADRDELRDVVLIHSAREETGASFVPELRRLAARYPGFTLVLRTTATQGRLDLSAIPTLCPDWARRHAYVCGPTAMIDMALLRWAEAGCSDRLTVERFRPALAADADARGGQVTFARTGRAARAPGDRPLLDVGEEAGVMMPSGCRMGICFTCVGRLDSGRVRDLRTGTVHGEEGDLVQTCVSAAAGPVSLDL